MRQGTESLSWRKKLFRGIEFMSEILHGHLMQESDLGGITASSCMSVSAQTLLLAWLL